MKTLLAPLLKISNQIEDSKTTVNEIYTILKVDLKRAAVESHKELVKHTVLLGEIKDLLKAQNKEQAKKAKQPKIKMPSIIGGAKAGLAIVLMAASLVAASNLMANMASITPAQFATAIAIGLVFKVLTPTFIEISESLKGPGIITRLVGKISGVGGGSPTNIMKNIGGTGLAMVVMSMAVVAASYAFKLITIPSASQILTAFLIGLAMIPMATTFGWFANAIHKAGFTPDKAGLKRMGMTALAMVLVGAALSGMAWALQSMPPQLLEPPELDWIFSTGIMLWIFSATFGKVLKAVKGLNLKELVFGSLAIPILAMSIVGIAWALSKYGGDITYENTPPVSWVLKVGLALFVFSMPFAMVMKAIKGAKMKDVVFATLALPLLAGAIFGVAWIFNYLSEIDAYNAPPVTWTLKAGLAMAVFGIPFILTALLIKKAGIGFMDLIKATVSVALIAGAILATAWIFSLLPEEYKAPPMEWALSAGIAIGIFAIPFMIIGFIAKSGGGAAAIGLGALGMILIAGTMWVVAWIFSALPDLTAISKNFTDAIMYPVNSMINALNRFKNEIGIENMLPMAGGILAIAGSWLALTAALAGSSIGGVLGAAANVGKAIFDGISNFFGGDAAETPISLLDKLIERKAGIQALAKAMPALGGQFAVIAAHTDSVVRGIGAFVPFLDEDNSEYFTTSATAAEKLANAYKKIGKATETMNVEAIKESRYMFEALTKLAEADGEDALTVFAEKLMVAVEELSGTVENLQNAVGEQSSGIKDVVGGLLSKVTDKVKEVTGGSQDNDTDTTSNNMGEVVELLGEIEERLNRPLRIVVE